LNKIEIFVYKHADIIHTVSNNFKYYLLKNFGNRNIKVYPCAITSVTQKKQRNKKTISFIYLGSIASWQKFEETVQLYGFIENSLTDVHLTIITKQKEEAKQIIIKNKINNFNIKSLTHKEVIKDLINYDFGFLLRDNIVVNNVASPIKFLEYISNGVIPIITKGIGDYSYITKKNNIGVLVDSNFTLDINNLSNILNDKEIYNKLHNVSKKYTWTYILKDFYNE
jgi:glycosyltransferase involved in cell wall biosynthesis